MLDISGKTLSQNGLSPRQSASNAHDERELFLNKAPSKALTWLVKRLEKASLSRIELQQKDSLLKVGAPLRDVPIARIRIYRPFSMLLAANRGVIGLAESYMKGDWDTPDLQALLDWGMFNEKQIDKQFSTNWLSRKLNRASHLLNNNSRSGSRRNIAAHYDLGNDFYQLWLDHSMTYSSAIFSNNDETLEQAQANKYNKVLSWLDIMPEHSVLEIGCGWGGFARSLQQQGGQNYSGVTLSAEQLHFARDSVQQEAGFNFYLKDYRDIKGQHDRIVSIEMLEAVGEKHWPIYFQKVCDALKPGGVAVIQVITIDEERFRDYRAEADFIQRYIFPGGMLPTDQVIRDQCHQAGLAIENTYAFGRDYAKTLSIWAESFRQRWPEIMTLGFDEHFKRMWLFYLAYCEAGFKQDSIDVRLYRISKPDS
ncbi:MULTISPECIES: cyclopropane-fatty-acyl-phospholipid synthase family protein [unclassified Endozoicomonas]|uniref:SAM-dependent methyltransferase n=1 Tax=unclassified Endozoicomonas TaxID=2644528 RepID=UPI0021495ABF|nr:MULTISPECIES: cyclopropane-fatty-acyl-phospholipid synthase family protein [unclassified Endozoicomonas]